jgi:outer membrane protein TolC
MKYLSIVFLLNSTLATSGQSVTPALALSPAPVATPALTELIDSAIHKDYGLANQQLDIQLTKLDAQKLKEAYLPRVDLSAKDAFLLSSFDIKSPNISIPQLNIDIREGHNRFTTESNLLTAGVNASLLLYSGGKIPALRKALAEKAMAQTFLLEKDRQDIVSEVIAAYDRLALLKQIRLVLDESEKRLAENQKTSDKAFAYGVITRYERQKIEVAQAQLSSGIEEYEGKRELVLEQLFLLTNIGKERLALIADPLKPILMSPSALTITDRAELKAIDATLAAGKYRITAEKTWFVPKIQAASSLGYLGLLAGRINSSEPVLQGGSKLSGTLPNFNNLPVFSIGIGLKWDIFDGKQGRREVQKAEIELLKTANDKKDITEKLELNLAKCQTDYSVSKSRVTVSRTQQQTAQNALTQATAEYRTGLIKSSQLIEAEEDFRHAALGYAQAIYDQRRAAIALLKATGNLTPAAIQ